ncbi:Conserved_hypothetical protein [Hexamita inflata]|uniref:Uncharacterized protein n=1 Tax=Hexamita inflata TaxID=28002 RepID=A0AA86PNV7_9EUKA|nr:Conserved hypothetical protein [Hexamita inflata]
MGVSISEPGSELRQRILSEFVRCGPQVSGDIPTISIKQLLEASRQFKVDLAHLPLLYMIDSSKQGSISPVDIFNLVSFQLQLEGRDPMRALKATATLMLNNNPQTFVSWFGQAVGRIDGIEILKNVLCVKKSSVLSIYEVLHVGITRVSAPEFVETLQIAGEQVGLQRWEGYVPVLVLQTFAQHVVNGIKELYKEIVEGVVVTEFKREFAWTDIKEEYEVAAKEAVEMQGEDSD